MGPPHAGFRQRNSAGRISPGAARLARTGDKSIHRPLVTKAPDEPEACRRAGRVIGEAWRRAGQPCCRSGERPCDDLRIHGFAKEGFDAVLDLFADNFASGTSLGSHAVWTGTARGLSTCRAGSGTRRPVNPGRRTRWRSRSPPPRPGPASRWPSPYGFRLKSPPAVPDRQLSGSASGSGSGCSLAIVWMSFRSAPLAGSVASWSRTG
jgi:hypothetical protein